MFSTHHNCLFFVILKPNPQTQIILSSCLLLTCNILKLYPESHHPNFLPAEPEAGYSPRGAGPIDKESGLLAKTHHSDGVRNR